MAHFILDMDHEENQLGVRLPEELRKQFSALEQRLWKAETAIAICSGLIGLLGSYLVLFVSDRIWDTPVFLRLLITIFGTAVLAFSGYRWALRWILKRRDIRALSNLVQLRFRRLGDRLLGIVELANEGNRPPGFSLALYRAAIDQVSGEATQFNFPDAVDPRPVKVRFWGAVCLAILFLLPAFLVPGAAWNVFLRWVSPVSAIERYTLVTIDELPPSQIVPHGEVFDVGVAVSYRSFWKPRTAIAEYSDQPGVKGFVDGGRIRFTIPGQIQAGPLEIRIGDATRTVSIVPTHRPSLKEMQASVELPAYLRYPSYAESVKNGSMTILEGSSIVFTGTATRSLKRAWRRSGEGAPEELNVDGKRFFSEVRELNQLVHHAFTWEDELGLTNSAPWDLVLGTEKDFPPVPQLSDFTRELAVLETEVIEIRAGARDDYGVREIGLVWRFTSDSENSTNGLRQGFRIEAASSQEKRLEERFYFNPALLGIPADSAIELRGYAKDFYPGREAVESQSYRLFVLGTEQHAEMVRQKLESMLVRLEEVTRLEEKIASSLQELKELGQKELSEEAAGAAMEEATEEQERNAIDLEQLAKEGTETVREGMRNPTLPNDKLQEWAKNVQAMQELAEGKMKDAANALKSAKQNQESKQENVAKAQEKTEEILEDLQEMQQAFNQGLDDLQALTLAQRLRKASSEEKEIENRLEKQVPETIGLIAEELSDKFRRVNERLAEEQTGTQHDAELLMGEISRFFERTQQPNYGQVSNEMADAKTVEELDRVRSLIAENISMQAMRQLSVWSERFTGWADILEPKSDSSGGGGGGGGGGENQQAEMLLKQLMALLRMREGEVNLRARTTLLEEKKKEDPRYDESVEMLYGEQRVLLKKLIQMQMDNLVPPLMEPLQEIYRPMLDSAMLLGEPRTDAPTVKAETETIQVLSDVINLINEQSQKGNNSQSQASEQMAFLLRMMSQQQGQNMGMALSNTPGGNSSGGTTDQAASTVEGDSTGKESDGKDVGKASGSIMRTVPTEFREALENYFNAIEETQK